MTDLVFELAREAHPVGEAGQRVVVGEETDVLFGLLPCRQIADGDSLVRLAGEIHLAKDHLGRYDTERRLQVGLQRHVGTLDQHRAHRRAEELGKLPAAHRGLRQIDHGKEALVGGDDLAIAHHQQTLHRRIGEATHPVALGQGAATIEQVEIGTAQREHQDHHRDQRDDDRQPLRCLILGRDDGETVLEPGGAHCGEVHGADREGEQDGGADALAQGVAVHREVDRGAGEGNAEQH